MSCGIRTKTFGTGTMSFGTAGTMTFGNGTMSFRTRTISLGPDHSAV
jgi:hypothetical protein